MMTEIKLLDAATVSQIAAGEVVERPASVIKELLENSIDAGSTAVTVEIRGAGIEYIRITDNGAGIPHSQVRMAFARHATSKLRSGGDLFQIRQLGFRGEALNAIAQVSRVEMKSRPAEQEHGMRVVNEGGQVVSLEEAGCPDGTTMIVRDLFFNTPVRRKFLRKPSQETAACSDIVMREMLAHPEISFRYVVDKKQVYRTPGDGKLRTALFCLYGREFAAKVVPVEGARPGISVEGFVGVGELARGNRREQSFLLNGRYIRSALLSRALEEACSARVMIQKFPVCALNIRVPLDSVDVNVHPNKLDVRFREEAALYRNLVEIVEASLALQDEMGIALPEASPAPAREEAPKERPAPSSPPERRAEPMAEAMRTVFEAIRPLEEEKPAPSEKKEDAPTPEPPAIAPEPPTTVPEPPVAEAQDFFSMEGQMSRRLVMQEESYLSARMATPAKIIGRIFSTYILLEKKDCILLIDQHAAHERLLYDRFQRSYGKPSAQYLLEPQVLELTHGELQRLRLHEDLLQNAGFIFEDFGDRSIRIQSIPHFLGEPYSKVFFRDMLDQLGDDGQNAEIGRERLITHACRMAIKAGDALSDSDVYALIRDIEETGVSTCPHGRPIYVEVSRKQIEKRFGRIV